MGTVETSVVKIIALGLTLIAWSGLLGIIWLISRVEVDAALIAVIAGPVGTAIGCLGTLLANPGSANVADVAAQARTEALADVASLVETPEEGA